MPVITEPRYDELIQGLIEKTREGKLQWEPTALADHFITVIGGEYGVALRRKANEYTLTIRDAGDREVISLEVGRLLDERVSLYDELKALFDLIVPQVATEGVNSVLETLKTL